MATRGLQRSTWKIRGTMFWFSRRPTAPSLRFAVSGCLGGEGAGLASSSRTKGQRAPCQSPAARRRTDCRTSAIFAVLAGASGPLSAVDSAGRFRQGKKVEREIALTLRAYLRYGDLASSDGGRRFTLRRAA